MKKVAFILFILFFCLALFYAMMQGDIGKNWVRKAFSKALIESGYQVEIAQVEGTLPHQINLKKVSLQKDRVHITIDEIRMRPVLWRLLKREVAFTDIQAKEVSISNGSPFNFSNGKFRMDRKRIFLRGNVDEWSLFTRYHLKTNDAEFTLASKGLVLRGTVGILPQLSAHIKLRSDLFISSIDIQQQEDAYMGKAIWQLAKSKWIGPVEGTATGIYRNQNIQGNLTAANLAKANFDLNIGLNLLIQGTTEINVENLQSLHIPNAFGKLHAKATWDAPNQIQEVQLEEGELSDFYYGDLFAQTVSLNAHLIDPFGKAQGLLDFSAKVLKWKHLELESASFETTLSETSSPYKLFAEGSLRHPFEIYSDGTWQDQLEIMVENFNGRFIDSPFVLESPVKITYKEDIFKIPNANLSVGDGLVQIDIDRVKERTEASLHASQIPIDFLSFNPLEVAVGGTITLDATLKEINNELNGAFSAEINQTAPMEAIGSFAGSFDKNLLKLKADLKTADNPLLTADVSLPIHLSIWPFEAEILYHKNAKGFVAFDGNVEEILEYFDLGTSRLQGHLQGSIDFQNTLYRPKVSGKFIFENGLYENYYTGTGLTNIQAEILAKENSIYLESLTAQDSQNGTVVAKGEMRLLGSDLYPFRIDATITHLLFSEIDLVTAEASGQVRIEGNALSSLATGNIDVHKIEVTIPDHIPRPLPHLDVVYRNAIHPVAPPEKKDSRYPLRLDLNASAPSDVTISGRGLNSHWKGEFRLGGTYTSLAAKGTLQLIEGEFSFSSRSFKLTEGSLNFSGIEHQMPYLNIAGEMETKGIVITARLKGPLDDPQLTLLSNPPLPLGSIMSYLLFGQDISEIGGFQALQLASSLASLAGTGPDVMETTRKSLGVDRLRVISDPNEEGGETVALQVGKYISKGVLVSFTQGTEESSTDISVEIELKNNFVFQIESDQHQEQGRFTLKWNHNY